MPDLVIGSESGTALAVADKHLTSSVGAGGFGAAQVQRQSVSAFGAGVSPMLVSNSYKILIDAQGVCNANLIAGQEAQLYIHVESGGTTFETLSVPANAQTGSPVI